MKKALPEVQIAEKKANHEAKTLMKKKQWEIWGELEYSTQPCWNC